MKIIITRTSNYFDPSRCSEAKKETLELTYLDYRTVNTLEEVKNRKWGEDWFNNGINHREENGMVVCDVMKMETVWTVKIDTIGDLIKLEKKYGSLIFMSTDYKEIPYEIEIYDDYRE